MVQLFTKKEKSIPIEDIHFAEYNKKSKSIEFYIRCKNKNLLFYEIQITSESNFRNYFLNRSIPYYKTDWTKGGERIEQKD